MSKFKVGDKVVVNKLGIADDMNCGTLSPHGICNVIDVDTSERYTVKVKDEFGTNEWYSEEMLDFAESSAEVLAIAEEIRGAFTGIINQEATATQMLIMFAGYIDGIVAGIKGKQ